MKIVDRSAPYELARSMEIQNQRDYDFDEEKLIVRFESGEDFDDFEGFAAVFMSVINERSHAHMQRQVDRMRQAWAANPTARPQAMDIGIPMDCLNKGQITKLTGYGF